MAILQIIQYPDLRLKRKGRLVKDIKASQVQQAIQNMLQTLSVSQNCAALAATQLDMEDPPRIVVINAGMNLGKVLCLINPEIVERSDATVVAEEGCMSIMPHSMQSIHVKVARAEKIKVKALDIQGKKLIFEATDFLARCIQHECDHLQGVITLDYLKGDERLVMEQKITTRL